MALYVSLMYVIKRRSLVMEKASMRSLKSILKTPAALFSLANAIQACAQLKPPSAHWDLKFILIFPVVSAVLYTNVFPREFAYTRMLSSCPTPQSLLTSARIVSAQMMLTSALN